MTSTSDTPEQPKSEDPADEIEKADESSFKESKTTTDEATKALSSGDHKSTTRDSSKIPTTEPEISVLES